MSDSAFVPADEDIRRHIREQVDTNMLVEAGAGTGKTTVLVERIAWILRTTDTRADELAVITFTEKAAAELASRVRQALEGARGAADITPEQSERVERALRDLNRAHIETIHAFAAGLLRERPVEAKLDPGFTVLDEMPSQLAFETAWSEWISGQMAEDPPPPALLAALELGLEFPRFRDAADRLNEHRDLLPLGEFAMDPVDPAGFLDALEVQAAVLRGMNPRMKDLSDKAYVAIPDYLRWADEILALRGHGQTLAQAVAGSTVVEQKNRGNQKNWVRVGDCRATKAAEEAIHDLIANYRSLLRQQATANLLRWLEGFVAFYGEQRRARGEADFDDLLIWARDLVRDSDEVRRYFAGRFRRILVDEFQDTDPLQVEMIVRICAERDPGPDWRTAKLRPGSLFVVGDPKQSIYRFRRADIGMYDAVKHLLFHDAQERISQNFRSVKAIIDWVNTTFSTIMHRAEGVQPEYVELDPGPGIGAADAVAFIDGDADGKAPEVRSAEADAVVALIEHSVREGAWTVRDRQTDAERPAERRDIAMLIPSRTDLHLYEQAFARAALPYRHEGGRTFFARQEVRELVAVLRAIDDPSDGVAAVAALRSSAFGCSDAELFAYRERAGFAQAYIPDDATGPVAEALRTLRRFSRERHTAALPDLIRDVLGETRLVEFAMLQPQGDQVAANLLKVIDQGRAFIEARGGGLRGFVRWLKTNMTLASDPRYGAAPEAEAAISEDKDDVVRILTVHAAKGLEFPIVVLANMESPRVSYTTVIPSHSADGPSLQMRIGKKELGFQTPGFAEAEQTEASHDRAEDQRLLYVATTRARDRIIVPLITGVAAKKRGEPPAREALNGLLRRGGIGETGTRIDAAELGRVGEELPVWRRRPVAATEAEVRAISDARGRWIDEHQQALARGNAAMLVRTATSLKVDAESEIPEEGSIRRRNAAEFGTAVHALLERIDLQRPEDAEALAAAIAREHALIGREREMAEVAQRALASAVIERARRSPRVLREVGFTSRLPDDGPDGLAEGRIDLLFLEDGGLVIVDFKTDGVNAQEAQARTEGMYRQQALVYAWAAHCTTGLPVREVVFLFARPSPAVTCPIVVTEAFMAEAEARMRTPAAAAPAGA